MESKIQKEVQYGTSFEIFWFKKIQINIDTDFNVFWLRAQEKKTLLDQSRTSFFCRAGEIT